MYIPYHKLPKLCSTRSVREHHRTPAAVKETRACFQKTDTSNTPWALAGLQPCSPPTVHVSKLRAFLYSLPRHHHSPATNVQALARWVASRFVSMPSGSRAAAQLKKDKQVFGYAGPRCSLPSLLHFRTLPHLIPQRWEKRRPVLNPSCCPETGKENLFIT
jgi:hypothetical protein